MKYHRGIRRQGRPPHADPPVKWGVNLPSTLARRVCERLGGQGTHDAPHAKRSELVQALLSHWLKQAEDVQERILRTERDDLDFVKKLW